MLSGFLAKSYVSASLAGLVLASGEPRFSPSGCGGHKNSGNVATFSEFLGRRTNFPPCYPHQSGSKGTPNTDEVVPASVEPRFYPIRLDSSVIARLNF